MARIEPANVEAAQGKQKELFETVQAKLGRIPNMLATLGQSPTALESYLVLSSTLSHGLLDAKTREQIALVVGQQNSCGYCLSAHSAIGKMAGLTEEQIAQAKCGIATDPKTAAILTLAKTIVDNRGNVTDAQVDEAKAQGVTDEELAEVVANVALNIYTNYFNHLADPVVDF